jgi:cyanophycin synthetase
MKKEKISFPVVIKPLDMAKGMGVSVNVKNEKQVSLAIKKIEKLQKKAPQKYSNFFMIEEMVSGNDYRILVLNNSVVACAQRIPATITGDNRTPIIDIIKSFNAQRPPAYQIKIDNEIKYFLKKHHLALGSILKKNQQLQLRENANISSGGRAIDLTKKISPRFKKIALQAFNALGLTYAGIDIITTDITANSSSQKYWIIEINGAPDYDIHEKPLIEGPGVDITNQLVDFFMQKPQS